MADGRPAGYWPDAPGGR